MSDRDRNRRSSYGERDGRDRDPFGRDESRRGNYNSPYPESTGGGSSSSRDSYPSYRQHDDRDRRRRSRTRSPPRFRGGDGGNRGFSRGGGSGNRGGSHGGGGRGDRDQGRRAQFNFSEEDWTQKPAQQEQFGRHDSTAEMSARTGVNPEALAYFEKLRNYTPYLKKRRALIKREGKEREFAEQLEDIQFWLNSARDINSDQTLGLQGLKNIVSSIMDMARLYPVKEDKPQQPVFDVSSGEEDEPFQPQPRAGPSTSFSQSKSPRGGGARGGARRSPSPPPRSARRSPSPSPSYASQRSSASARPRSKIGPLPKAGIKTNWNYDPTKPDADDEEVEEEEQEAPWSELDRELDREFYGQNHSSARDDDEREDYDDRTRTDRKRRPSASGSERSEKNRNPSPPPQTRSHPVTPNQRQTDRGGRAPLYNPFDQLSDDDDASDFDGDVDSNARPTSPAPAFSDNFENMYQRPVRNQQPVPEPQQHVPPPCHPPHPQQQPHQHPQRPRTEFHLLEHGFLTRHAYNPENNRRLPDRPPGSAGDFENHANHVPPPEIPFEDHMSATNIRDPRQPHNRQPQVHPGVNGHDPRARLSSVTGDPRSATATSQQLQQPHNYQHPPQPQPQPWLDPRMNRMNPATTPIGNGPPSQSLPVDPRLGPSRAPTYAVAVANPGSIPGPIAIPGAGQFMGAPPLMAPKAAEATVVAMFASEGLGLRPDQVQHIAMRLNSFSEGSAVNVGAGVPPPVFQQPAITFPGQRPGFPPGGTQQFPGHAQGQFFPPQQRPLMPAGVAGVPTGPQHQHQGQGAPAAQAPEPVNQELLQAMARAKAQMCFGSRAQRPQNRQTRPNFNNPPRFTGPSRHGAPNRFPFKQNIPFGRMGRQEEARRREIYFEKEEREREEQRKKEEAEKEAQKQKEAPMIATNQIPATVRPGMKPRAPSSGSGVQRQHSTGSESGSTSSSSKNRGLEETLQRVQDKLSQIPTVSKKSKFQKLREEATKTLRVNPESVAARRNSAKSKTTDRRSPSPPPEGASTSSSAKKVQKSGNKRRRISSSGSEGDGSRKESSSANAKSIKTKTRQPKGYAVIQDEVDNTSRGSEDMDLSDSGCALPSEEEPEPPPPGTTPPPQLPDTTSSSAKITKSIGVHPDPSSTATPPSLATPTDTVTSTTSATLSPTKKGNRELNDLHGYLREMNFESQLPTGRRRCRGVAGTAATDSISPPDAAPVPNESSASTSSSASRNLTDTINSVAKGRGRGVVKPKAAPKGKTGATTTPGTGRGRGRPPKTSPGIVLGLNLKKKAAANKAARGRGRKKPGPKAGAKKRAASVSPDRPSQVVIDTLAAIEAASAATFGMRMAGSPADDEVKDVSVSSCDLKAEKSIRGGIVIGPNDIIVNSALGKIKMEKDYVAPSPATTVKTEPLDTDADPPFPDREPKPDSDTAEDNDNDSEGDFQDAEDGDVEGEPYPQFNIGQDGDDEVQELLPPHIKLEPEDIDISF